MGQLNRKPLQRTVKSTAGDYSLPLTPDSDSTHVIIYVQVLDASNTATGLLEVLRDNTWFRADLAQLNGWVEFNGLVPDGFRLTGTLGAGDTALMLMDQRGG
jgi:hypothetical protein